MDELDPKKTTGDLFKSAIEAEQKVSDIYKEFAKLFSHVLNVAAFWTDLSEDELNHKKTLENIYNSLSLEQILSVPDEKMVSMSIKIEHELKKNIIGSINNLDDAYELAHDMENSEVNAVYKFLTNKFIPFQERSQFIVANIQYHLEKLVRFNHDIGDRVWRKKIVV